MKGGDAVIKAKPLGAKCYGHIPHLPGSRRGPGDHKVHEGQERIATAKARDRHDEVIVQEKVDGSNVGVARIDGTIIPLTRAGYLASTSRFEQHRHLWNWAYANQERFMDVLEDGERLCGEWLMQAHGTRYDLRHEPFVAFDLMRGTERMPFDAFMSRIEKGGFTYPHVIHRGQPLRTEGAMKLLGTQGFHGAIDPVEGAVWRIERNHIIDRKTGGRKRIVDFLCKYVRPDKVDGLYLPEQSGKEAVWNWRYERRDAYDLSNLLNVARDEGLASTPQGQVNQNGFRSLTPGGLERGSNERG